MGFVNDPTSWPNHATVHVPQSAALAGLLVHAGPWVARAGLPAAAEPGNGATGTVTVLEQHRGNVRDDLAKALAKARLEGHPAYAELAQVAAQLGVEDAPGPVQEVEPTLA
jgi:hypothetical protein